MKRFQWYLLFYIMLHISDVVAFERNPTKKSLYGYYIIAKEVCRAFLFLYFIDEAKLDQATISCSACHQTMKASYLFGWCVGRTDDITINNLAPLIYYGTAEELANFLFVTSQELSIPCHHCQQYQGWYITHQSTL